MKRRLKIGLIHPGRGRTYSETIENIEKANDACLEIRRLGHIPVAPMVTFLTEGWFDEHADETNGSGGGRLAGMNAGQVILTTCGLDAAIIYAHNGNELSTGMIADLDCLANTILLTSCHHFRQISASIDAIEKGL